MEKKERCDHLCRSDIHRLCFVWNGIYNKREKVLLFRKDLQMTELKEDEKECLKLGVSDFIVKPYSPLLVKMRVENIIHMTESEDMISELEMDALTG